MASANPRKRLRESDASRRVATHVEVVVRRKSLWAAAAVPQSPVAPPSVPLEQNRERCRRCRQGARLCVYPDDDSICIPCAKANAPCKLPTIEEAAALDARCTPCIKRGINCNREVPCNSCIRRHKTHLCGELPVEEPSKRIKREISPSPELEEDEAAEETETADDVDMADDTWPPTDDGENHEAVAVESYTASSTVDALTLRLSPQCLAKLHTSGRLTVLDESGAFKASYSITRVNDGVFLSGRNKGYMSQSEEATAVEQSPPENDEGVASTAEESSPPPPSQFAHNDHGSRPYRSRARVSYVEALPSDTSDHAPEIDTGSDTYESYPDSEGDDEQSADEVDEVNSSQDEDMLGNTDVDDAEPPIVPKTRRRVQNGQNPQRKAGKGIDDSLPPLHDIQSIFNDLTLKAVELGLCDALAKLAGRPINVATMCSGTESPLIALDCISQALTRNQLASFRIKHHFSAEIDAVKQGFIERNFAPEKLFRDVREFLHDDAKFATTAYGAQTSIPGNIDILVAGFVCKDISLMNNHKKDLFEDDGESGDTWRAIYSYAKQFTPSIVLIENVTGRKAYWDRLVLKWSQIGYESAWVICDSKKHYLSQTRQRMYMIAMNRNLYGKNTAKAVCEWKSLMMKLQRQCSSPYEAFLTGLSQDPIDYNALPSEYDWALCKLRYDHIRTDQRLGIMRPVTQWSENGTLRPPDFANRKWYNSQSSRVYDAIDVAHLQGAQNGSDSMYKMAIWDVSQNVDRFKADLGLVPCITPGGCDFASNRQQALTGSQLLVLQGMPLDKLIFAGESQKDCQDLAGNAMSTTVIGTSLIAAIVVGARAFRATDSTRTDDLSTAMAPQTLGNELVTPSSTVTAILRPSDMEHPDVVELINEAISSSRMCKCEGNKKICDMPIQVCSACGHTACLLCAGNPRHEYVKIGPTPRQSPDAFIRRWKPRLPARLQFENFPDIFELASETGETDASTKAFVDRISELDIGSQHFCISSVERQDRAWKVLYTSDEATLELNISAQIQWLIFAKCSPKSSGNSTIRKVLKQPVARGTVDESLMNPQWEVLIPRTKKYKIYLAALSERTKSWRNRLGLPDFKSETIPVTLQIQSSTSDGSALEGSYSIQPHCGTASGSLYRSHHNPPLFLFLDPNPIGGPSDDSFVFSFDCSRKHYGEARISLAHLNASWRPWQMDNDNRCEITATSSGVWIPTSMRLTSPPVSITASVLSGYSVGAWKGCRDAITVLDVHLPEKLNTQKFSDYSWALEQARSLPSLSQWQPLDAESQACDCAPSYPKILWSIDEAGIATAHEDRKAAANFERSVKTRCPIFHISANHNSENTHIKIGINVASLCHRAASRLGGSNSMTAWRLLTDHTDMGSERFPKFRLRSNAADIPYSGPLRLQHDLRGAQPRSLSWMKLQEVGVSLTITEVEENIHSSLNWRVEARAQTSVRIQGGVLADAPSFGKTVTTIALIQSEFEEHTSAALLKKNRSQTEHLPSFIDVVGTLIVCPPHMVIQWQEELKSFLGTKQYEKFKVLLIEDFNQLCELTIEAVQDSRVVILSWNVFADEEYISELARFAAMPEPAATGRRAYSAWLNEVTDKLPARLAALDTTDYDSFQKDSEQLLEERLQLPEFRAAIPLKVQHGSSYQSFNAMQAAATGKRRASGMKPKSKSKGKGKSRAAHPIPLLHLFRFNRVVVDEYHYLNQDKKIENLLASVSVKSIAAVKRWVLSGTPALANFHDIDQIASFLGTKLGRFANGASRMPTQLEKAIRDDQTDVEKFLSKTETMSRQWHQARHELAQMFLDRFVRQNEPSLEHIDCSEELCPIELNVAHHAVYLELSQHLISQRMQVRKLNNKTNSDRLLRLNASLNNSATAEEALLKSALLFKTLDGESGIEALMQKREEQRRDTERELLRLLCGFEGLKKDADIADLYNGFKNDVKIANWLGDESASKRLCDRLKKAEKNPTRGGFEELRRVPKSKLTQEIKKLMSQLRESARELALRFRSERFIRAIEGLLGPLSRDSNDLLICNSPHCEGATITQLNLASHCGHLACNHCLRLRTDDECCVHQGCNVTVQAVNLIKATDLGSTREQVAERSFGRKMDAIADLVLDIPEQDQCLVFAPNDETIDILEEVFDYHEIAFSSTRGIRPAAVARVLEDFKASSSQKRGGSRVLILNLTSETAAGVNLTNANHVIFVAPLLVKSQYEYESAMTQAIARSRRYGQEKRVHIYHFAALRTIDVDILEHRHKRRDGITSAKKPMRLVALPAEKKEKTKLVKNGQNRMALVPVSWVTATAARLTLGVEEQPDSFTSLINFSETFENEEEES